MHDIEYTPSPPSAMYISTRFEVSPNPKMWDLPDCHRHLLLKSIPPGEEEEGEARSIPLPSVPLAALFISLASSFWIGFARTVVVLAPKSCHVQIISNAVVRSPDAIGRVSGGAGVSNARCGSRGSPQIRLSIVT